MATFQTECSVHCAPERAFEYLSTPRNFPDLALPDISLTIESAPQQFALGSRIRFAISAMGHVVRSEHEVTEFDAPLRFVETQVEGPFARWRHEHEFLPGSGGTLRIVDRIEFLPPKGLLGLMMSESRIRAQLEEGFEHRRWKLQQILNSPSPEAP